MKSDLENKIEQILRTVFQSNTFTFDRSISRFDLPKWDSLNHMQIISQLEKTFNIRFEAKEVLKLKNLGDLSDSVNSKLTVQQSK